MKKRFTEEQIIRILGEAETSGAQIREIARKHNITEQTFFRWRNKYGGMDVSDARRLKELEGENAKLKRPGSRADASDRRAEGVLPKKMSSPAGRRAAMEWMTSRGVIEAQRLPLFAF